MGAIHIIKELTSCGISLTLDERGNIKAKSDETVISESIIETIRQNKAEIIRELSETKPAKPISSNPNCNRLLSLMAEFNRLIVSIETETREQARFTIDRINTVDAEIRTIMKRILMFKTPIDFIGSQIVQCFGHQEGGGAFPLNDIGAPFYSDETVTDGQMVNCLGVTSCEHSYRLDTALMCRKTETAVIDMPTCPGDHWQRDQYSKMETSAADPSAVQNKCRNCHESNFEKLENGKVICRTCYPAAKKAGA